MFRIAKRVRDAWRGNTGECYDVAGLGFRDFDTMQAEETEYLDRKSVV